jgi:predicted TIM-barrel fold metal-dependent hydrolase
MVIDFHTHLWPYDFLTDDLIKYFKSRGIWDERYSILTAQRLLDIMDHNDITQSIVLSSVLSPETKNSDILKMNEYISEQISVSKERFLGFFTLNPFFEEEAMDVLEASIRDLGLLGMKIHPSFQEIYPNNKILYPFYKKMEEYRLPVLFHSGSIGILPYKDFYSNPSFVDEVACDFPRLIIIIGHSGKIWYDETAMLLRKHKNIYSDISTNIGRDPEFGEHPMSWLLYKIKSYAGCLDRVFFGSDYPLYMQDETLTCINSAIKLLNKKYKGFIGNEDIENIMYGNASNLIDRIKNYGRY